MSTEFEALVKKVARALCADSGADPDSLSPWSLNQQPRWKDYRDAALIAIRVVAEALREPPTRIKTATGFGIPTTTADEHWRAMLAAHPIMEALRDE